MFAVVLAVVLPVVITVAVGFLWTRYGYPLNSKELTALIADGKEALDYSALGTVLAGLARVEKS